VFEASRAPQPRPGEEEKNGAKRQARITWITTV